MRVVALITVRNEELHLRRCLEHLVGQGIESCVIDNDSSDNTRRIAEDFLSRGRGVCQIAHLPFRNHFDLEAQCKHQEQLASQIPADWFIHHDADEIMEAPARYSTLAEGISHVNALGYSAIKFDEFVFVPVDDAQSFE